MASPPPNKSDPANAPPSGASQKPTDDGKLKKAAEEPREEVSAIRAGAGPSPMPSGVPSVAPTKVELRKGSAPKAPGIPRELLEEAKKRIPPPTPQDAKDAAEAKAKKAEDGLIELVDVDIEVVRNPAQAASDSDKPSSRPPKQLSAICDFGRYEIMGRIAFGGMAEIFLARESSEAAGSRYLVIKRILPHVADDDNFVKMFLDEARLAMQLNHPNICHIYEFGQLDNSYFIAMEWINGVQLGKLIRRARAEGGVPASIGVKIISRIAEALHYAHRAKDQMGKPLGIVHRDVSPHNIMISYDGNVKLLDFGIAKASSHSSKTQAGVIKGKFSYMSPQQCLGQPIDGRADVFALGVCLYETITGKPLYHRKTEYETMRAVIEDPVPSIRESKPELSEALDKIVQRSLAKAEADRYSSAGEMQEELEAWLADNRKIVNAAKIGEFMENIYEDEIKRGPLVDSTPFGMSLNQYPGTPISGSGRRALGTGSRSGEMAAPPAKKLTAAKVVLALAMAAVLGAAFALTSGGDEETRAQATPPPQPLPPAAAVPEEPEEEEVEEVVPAVEPAGPQFGALVIRSVPSGASIRIGERELTETTPTVLTEVPVGNHPIVLTRDGYQRWEGEVEITPDERSNVNATLERERRVRRAPAAPPGRLSINTRPWSKVYVGGRLLGTTPIGGATVPSGNLRLRLVDRDGNTHYRAVQVGAGDEARAFFDLE